MSNRGITASIVMTKDSETCAYLRIEASNGQTYARVTDKFRKRPPEVQFCTWAPTRKIRTCRAICGQCRKRCACCSRAIRIRVRHSCDMRGVGVRAALHLPCVQMVNQPRESIMPVFVKPLWNVRCVNGQDVPPERTTLAVESVERRYGTGRGYCVTADSGDEARKIAWDYQRQTRHDVPECDRVQLIEHRRVPVLMAAPRW